MDIRGKPLVDTAQQVDSLRKITLSVIVGRTPGSCDFTPSPIRFSFIYGIGPAGLTPFECELPGLSAGDSVHIQTEPGTEREVFGHLRFPMPGVPKEPQALHYTFRIDEVIAAEPREVIRALAEAASCGDDCCGH